MNSKIKYLQHKADNMLRTDTAYLFKSGSWNILNFLMTVGFGVLTTIALANWLPKNILGTYQFILAIASILAVCTLSGVGTAIVRSVARGEEGMFRYGFRLKLKWSVIIVIISGVIATYYYLMGDVTLATAFLIVGVATPLIESFRLYEDYLRGKEAFKQTVTLGFWRKPIPLLAVAAAAYFSNDVLVLIAAYFISHTVSYGLVYFQVVKKYRPPVKKSASALTLSAHLSVMRVITMITTNIDKIVIWHFLGPVAVASFTIAQVSTRYAGGTLNSLAAIALPKVARQDLKILQSTLPRKVAIFTLGMMFAALVYVLLVPLVFSVVFPQYPESVIIAQILSVFFILSPSKIFSQVLIAHDLLKAQYMIIITSPLTLMTSLWVLTPKYELLGAALSVVITGILVTILNYLFFSFSSKKTR